MTAQVYEKLVFEGEETSMAFCPPLPYGHPRLIELSEEEMEEEGIDSLFFSTDCWRGYIGSWEIKEGLFNLVALTGEYKMLGDEPIFADWFDGVLRIPKGECLHYVHMGFASVYEEEIHVKIENGLVVQSRIIDNRNKEVNRSQLAWQNLPGFENDFDGDDEMWEWLSEK